MTEREQLEQQKNEDTSFALLMKQAEMARGKTAAKKVSELKDSPDFEPSKAADRRYRSLIRTYTTKRSLLRIIQTGKPMRKWLPAVACILLVLFAGTYSFRNTLSPSSDESAYTTLADTTGDDDTGTITVEQDTGDETTADSESDTAAGTGTSSASGDSSASSESSGKSATTASVDSDSQSSAASGDSSTDSSSGDGSTDNSSADSDDDTTENSDNDSDDNSSDDDTNDSEPSAGDDNSSDGSDNGSDDDGDATDDGVGNGTPSSDNTSSSSVSSTVVFSPSLYKSLWVGWTPDGYTAVSVNGTASSAALSYRYEPSATDDTSGAYFVVTKTSGTESLPSYCAEDSTFTVNSLPAWYIVSGNEQCLTMLDTEQSVCIDIDAVNVEFGREEMIKIAQSIRYS